MVYGWIGHRAACTLNVVSFVTARYKKFVVTKEVESTQIAIFKLQSKKKKKKGEKKKYTKKNFKKKEKKKL